MLNPFRDETPGGFREFFAIAFPLVISKLSLTLMNFTDRLFLSWSSAEELAAALPAGILAFTLMSFFIGVCEFSNTLVAQNHGAKHEREATLAMWQGVFFAVAASLVCYAMTPLGLWLLDHSNHGDLLIDLEKTYFIYFWTGAIFMITNFAFSSFYSGRGETHVVMYVNIIGNAINIILDYALIFGVWGFPQLGIKGAAIATVIANALITLMFLTLILSPKNRRERASASTIHIHMPLLRRMLKFGAPAGMHYLLEIGAFTVFIFLLGQLGQTELAASNIVLALNMVAFIPMHGCGVAAGTLVGRYIGKQDLATAEKSGYTAWYSAEAYMIVCGLIYILFPHTLIGWFLMDSSGAPAPDDTIIHMGTIILYFVAFYQIADAMLLAFSGALRGAGDTLFSMWVQIICAWLFFVPGTYAAVVWWDWGVYGAWGWATAFITLTGVIYWARFRSGVWKHIDVISNET